MVTHWPDEMLREVLADRFTQRSNTWVTRLNVRPWLEMTQQFPPKLWSETHRWQMWYNGAFIERQEYWLTMVSRECARSANESGLYAPWYVRKATLTMSKANDDPRTPHEFVYDFEVTLDLVCGLQHKVEGRSSYAL